MIDDWDWDCDCVISWNILISAPSLPLASVFWLVTRPGRPIRRFVISTFLSVPGKPLCWECWEFSANIHSLPVSSGRLKNSGIFISGGHVKTGLKGFFWRYNFLLIITFVLETVIWKWGWGGVDVLKPPWSLLLNMRTRRCYSEKLYLPSSLLFFSTSFIFSSCCVQLSWVNIEARSKISAVRRNVMS